MERAYSYRLIEAAQVMDTVSPIGGHIQPANERQVRPLTKLGLYLG